MKRHASLRDLVLMVMVEPLFGCGTGGSANASNSRLPTVCKPCTYGLGTVPRTRARSTGNGVQCRLARQCDDIAEVGEEVTPDHDQPRDRVLKQEGRRRAFAMPLVPGNVNLFGCRRAQ